MAIFDDIRYFLASSLPLVRQEQLEFALSKNGATKADSVATATHVVTDSPNFAGHEGVLDSAAVVSDYWVDRSLALEKVQPPQYYSVESGMLFSGVVACAAELPSHDLEVLSAGISALGGQWRIPLTNDVTHLFVVSKNSAKYASAISHCERTNIKILLPHWFDDSVRLGIRDLPVDPYLWPDPPLLKDIGVVVKVEDKSKADLMTTANKFTPAMDSRVPLPKDVDLMPVKKDAWGGKRILLSWTLALYGSRREAVEAGIRRAGGEVLRYPGDHDSDLGTEDKEKRRDRQESRAVAETDILITRWRNGRAYGKAFRLHKTIGTMAWLYQCQSTGLIPRPVDQLLHYPVPRRPIENFSKHEITVTNYTGEAREYIKRLISAMGATFTPSMTGRNTVLIAAYVSGQKAEKARSWSIPVVNHTWLEDCFIQWRHLTTATEKYIMFPPGIDFSRLLCERGVGGRGVELCEEEEAREEGTDGESDFDVAMTVDKETEDDGKATKGMVEEDIDMINMSDTDAIRGHNALKQTSPAKSNGRVANSASKSVSPAKQIARITHVSSPTKVTSPNKRQSKSVSPTKRRKINEDEIAIHQHDSDDDEEIVRRMKATRPRKSTVLATDDDRISRLSSPAPKPKSKTISSSAKTGRGTRLLVDSDVSDVDNQPGQQPDFYKSPAKSKAKGDAGRKPQDEAETSIEHSPWKTKLPSKRNKRAFESSDGEDDGGEVSPAPRPKKLIRRLTSEASLQLPLEKEKKKVALDGPATIKRLVRRVSGKPSAPDTDTAPEHEKENLATSPHAPSHDSDKDVRSKSSLLRLRKGDARTRIRAKSTATKAKEYVYSESEDEVAAQPMKVKGKGKAVERKAPEKGRKRLKKVASEDEETPVVESEDESDEEAPKSKPPAKASPIVNRVSVVVDPPRATKHAAKTTYGSRGKKKATVEEDSASEDTRRRTSARRLQKNESIHVEAPEKAAATILSHSSPIKATHIPTKPKSRLKRQPEPDTPPPPISSPLSAIDNTHPNFGDPPAKRGAAAKAEAKLREMMPDATKYEQEVKKARKSGGWSSMWEKEDREDHQTGAMVKREEGNKKRKSEITEVDDNDQQESRKKKRKSSTLGKRRGKSQESEENEAELAEVRDKGRVKRELEPGTTPSHVHLITTQVKLPPDTTMGLQNLGVVFTSNPSECTHLLAPSLVRTEKLLCALATAPFILHPSWAITSARQKQLLPVDKFMLKDGVAESKYRMRLSEAVARAKELKGTLFSQMTFYVTAKTKVEYKLLKSVVTAHGGQLVKQSPTVRLISGHEHRHVISCPEDISIWRPLATRGIPIFTHEFLLIGVLKQELEWDSREFRVPGSFNS